MLEFTAAVRFTRKPAQIQGFLSLWFIHFRVAIVKMQTPVRAQDSRAYITKRQYILDETKRRSLQPQNQNVKPHNWVDLSGGHGKAAVLDRSETTQQAVLRPRDPTKKRIGPVGPPTPPLEATFTHDFFGSQLVVGDIPVAINLTRKKHRMEITKDQLLIDNVPQSVNQGDFERIKQIIRETRV